VSVEALPSLSAVDVVALGVLALGGLHGYLRGLSGELAQLAAVVGGLVCGLWMHAPLAERTAAATRLEGRPAQAVAFAASVAAAFAVVLLLRALLKPVMRVIVEERFEKPGGVVAGLLRGGAVVVLVFVLLNLWPHPYLNRTFGETSLFGSLIRRHLPAAERDGKEN
jgi:uncharacterized membrane protein required for colicin V production